MLFYVLDAGLHLCAMYMQQRAGKGNIAGGSARGSASPSKSKATSGAGGGSKGGSVARTIALVALLGLVGFAAYKRLSAPVNLYPGLSLVGKHAVVAGATNGIGRGVALRLAQVGPGGCRLQR